MTLTKSVIAKQIALENGFSRKKSQEVVEQLIQLMKHSLENSEEIMISGFGKFTVRNKNPRLGRNPSTGLRMIIQGRRVVKFKCSRKLKEKIKRS